MSKRRIGALLLLMALLALLAACDATGLPASQTPQATVAAELIPTVPDRVELTPTSRPTTSRTTPTQEGISEATSEPGVTATARPAGTAQAQIDLQVIEIEQDAEKVRGLTAKVDVPETFVDKAQMRTNITKLIEEDFTREDAQNEAARLWLLRLLNDPKMDFYQLQLDLHSDVVLGYYDQRKDDLFVLKQGDTLSAQTRSTIAHEFVHSLQDEYYDLEKLIPENSIQYDRDTAVRSLVEGDAVVSEEEYKARFFTPDDTQELQAEENNISDDMMKTLLRTPRYVLLALYFPYIQGQDFVKELKRIGGFKRIDAALADPPQSTEQILHPQKYLDSPRDNPIKVTIPPLTSTLTTLSPGWKMVDEGSIGEFDFQQMLKLNGVSDSEADAAAAGWGGAWYAQYQNGDTNVLAVDSQWDTLNDAKQFSAALDKSFLGADKEGALWAEGGRYFSAVQTDKRVLYLSSTDKKALETVAGALQ